MGKKIVNVVLFLAVLAAAVGITIYTGNGLTGTTIFNFVFLAIMAVIYLVGLFGGMFRMNHLAEAFSNAAEELTSIFKNNGKVAADKLEHLRGIFLHKYLDGKMDAFVESIEQSEEGIGDLEDYISEAELDIHIHKRLLEMVPDIFTSLGILGTFIGLVLGLKDFQPNDYAAMTSSVASLVEGIKVAFLTSIYGIAFSVVYSYGMKTEYSAMNEKLQSFLDKFHACVMPTAENESRNLLVATQKNTANAMEQMTEQVTLQMAKSFEKVITPTFEKMNNSLDKLVSTVTECQTEAVQELTREFLREMNNSFKMEFRDFNIALERTQRAMKENTEYTSNLYQSLSKQLNESYMQQERTMKALVEEIGGVQAKYMATASKVLAENREIQIQQQKDYQHLSDYLKDAEKTSAKFWVACNQAMQKYVDAAAQGMDRISSASQVSEDVLRANKRVMDELNMKIKELTDYQKISYKTMEQVRVLLSDITVAKNNREIYLSGGANSSRDSMKQVQEMLEAQTERQQEFLDEMSKNMKDMSKNAQKGKFGLFR